MTYAIKVHENVTKEDLKKLSKHLKNMFSVAIRERIAERPYDFKPLKGKRYRNIWRLRVGDYRIAYEIMEEENTIRIICIETYEEKYTKSWIADLISI